MKKLLLITLLFLTVLMLASCNEGYISANTEITGKNGAGTKSITVEILHDDALRPLDNTPVADNFSKHLKNGSEPIVEKLKAVSPIEDLQVTLVKDDVAKADYVTMTYNFDSIYDYNTKTKKMAEAMGLDFENAKLKVKGDNVTFTEKSSNLHNSIAWAHDAIYYDPNIYFSDGARFEAFASLKNFEIKVGDASKTYSYNKEDTIYYEVTGRIEGEAPEPQPTPEITPLPTPDPVEMPSDEYPDETITVDFNAEIALASSIGSGFIQAPLNGLFDEMITGVNPTLWRYGWVGEGFQHYDRVRKLTPDAWYQIVVSDMIYIQDPLYMGKDLEGLTRAVVQKAKDLNMTNVQFDIINEPNLPPFSFDLPTLCYWWDKCYKAAKEINPDAVLVGPSYSSFRRADLKAFLDHCKENDTVPDILNWHFSNIKNMQLNVQEITDYAKEIGVDDKIKYYCINENILSEPWMSKSAGHVVQLFQMAERNRVHTAHAVWNGDENYSGLDGIIAPNFTKTAQWWAYNTYVNMKGIMVDTIRSESYEAVASKDLDGKKAKIMIGDNAQNHKDVIAIINNIPNEVIKDGKVHVKLEKIPYADQKSPGPVIITEGDYDVVDNSLIITVHMNPMDASIITLTPEAEQPSEEDALVVEPETSPEPTEPETSPEPTEPGTEPEETPKPTEPETEPEETPVPTETEPDETEVPTESEPEETPVQTEEPQETDKDINDPDQDDKTPDTGDNTPVLFAFLLAIIAAAIIAYLSLT